MDFGKMTLYPDKAVVFTLYNISKILLVAITFEFNIAQYFDRRNGMKAYTTFAIVAAVAVMLVASAAVATEDAFAGKKHQKYNQALSQANACGNGELPLNVFCSNSASQIQGDENAVSTSSSQAAE